MLDKVETPLDVGFLFIAPRLEANGIVASRLLLFCSETELKCRAVAIRRTQVSKLEEAKRSDQDTKYQLALA